MLIQIDKRTLLIANLLFWQTGVTVAENLEVNRYKLIAPFLIDETYLVADCETLANKQQNKPTRQQRFKKAVCRFHQMLMQTSVQEAEIARLIALIRVLQTLGISGAQQTFSALMEGLLHCQNAKLAIPVLVKQPKSEHARLRLCTARRNAVASFSDIDWSYAQFDYAENLSHNIYDLLAEMAACYTHEDNDNNGLADGALNAEFHRFCDQTTISKPEREKIIAEETKQVFEQYFGSTSPLTAMFERKKHQADSIQKRANSAVEALATEVKQITNVHSTLQTHFDTQIRPKVADIIRDYNNAYAIGKTILDTYHQWQSNPLINKHDNDRDIGADLVGESAEYGSQGIKGRLEKLLISFKSETQNAISSAQQISQAIKRFQDKKRETKTLTKTLCQVYYCEIARDRGFFFNPFKKACFKLSDNPLCPNHNPTARITVSNTEHSLTISELCKRVGFESDRFGKMGMSTSEADECFKPSITN